MRINLLTIQLFILFLFPAILSAQKEEGLKKKIDSINGQINKIEISTDEGNVVFEGKEAEELFKRIKADKTNILKWISENDNDFTFSADGDDVMIFKSENGDEHIIKSMKGDKDILIFKHGDIDDINVFEDGNFKKIKVEVDSAEGKDKKVTVTTFEDGEEKIEVLEGEEADEYLEKMGKDGDSIFDIELDVEVDSDGEHIWIHKNRSDSDIEKDVKVEIVDGVKKITVTTVEDEKETVKVYEGDEADEYFENEKNTGKHEKIIIKKLKKKEDDN